MITRNTGCDAPSRSAGVQSAPAAAAVAPLTFDGFFGIDEESEEEVEPASAVRSTAGKVLQPSQRAEDDELRIRANSVISHAKEPAAAAAPKSIPTQSADTPASSATVGSALLSTSSTAPPSTLLLSTRPQRYLDPEPDTFGNLEYKYQLRPSSLLRFAKLVTQLQWRLLEGGGRWCTYELGVLDDGALIGLAPGEMRESLSWLRSMVAQLVTSSSSAEQGADGASTAQADGREERGHVIVRRCIAIRDNLLNKQDGQEALAQEDEPPAGLREIKALGDEEATALLRLDNEEDESNRHTASFVHAPCAPAQVQTTARLPHMIVGRLTRTNSSGGAAQGAAAVAAPDPPSPTQAVDEEEEPDRADVSSDSVDSLSEAMAFSFELDIPSTPSTAPSGSSSVVAAHAPRASTTSGAIAREMRIKAARNSSGNTASASLSVEDGAPMSRSTSDGEHVDVNGSGSASDVSSIRSGASSAEESRGSSTGNNSPSRPFTPRDDLPAPLVGEKGDAGIEMVEETAAWGGLLGGLDVEGIARYQLSAAIQEQQQKKNKKNGKPTHFAAAVGQPGDGGIDAEGQSWSRRQWKKRFGRRSEPPSHLCAGGSTPPSREEGADAPAEADQLPVYNPAPGNPHLGFAPAPAPSKSIAIGHHHHSGPVQKSLKKRSNAMQRSERRRLEMRRKEREGMGIFDVDHPDFLRHDPVFAQAVLSEHLSCSLGAAAEKAATGPAFSQVWGEGEDLEDEDEASADEGFFLGSLSSFEDDSSLSFMASGPIDQRLRRRSSKLTQQQTSPPTQTSALSGGAHDASAKVAVPRAGIPAPHSSSSSAAAMLSMRRRRAAHVVIPSEDPSEMAQAQQQSIDWQPNETDCRLVLEVICVMQASQEQMDALLDGYRASA